MIMVVFCTFEHWYEMCVKKTTSTSVLEYGNTFPGWYWIKNAHSISESLLPIASKTDQRKWADDVGMRLRQSYVYLTAL